MSNSNNGGIHPIMVGFIIFSESISALEQQRDFILSSMTWNSENLIKTRIEDKRILSRSFSIPLTPTAVIDL